MTDNSPLNEDETIVVNKKEKIWKPPAKYQVVLHNDDYTPMDFVVDILQRFFACNEERAVKIMLEVHHKGKGICGIYSAEIAEMKSTQVNDYAKKNQYPLLCTYEKVE